MGFYKQEYWSGLPFPSSGADPWIELMSLVFPELAGRFYTTVPLSTPTISKKKDGKSTEKEQTMVKGENDQLSESDNKE